MNAERPETKGSVKLQKTSRLSHVSVPDAMLEMKRWSQRWTPAEWVEFLAAEESPTDLRELRRSTHTGRPLGTPEFVEALEKSSLRPLAARKAGRRARPGGDTLQAGLTFVA